MQLLVIGVKPNEAGSAWRFKLLRPWLSFWTGIFLRLGLGFWTAGVTGWEHFEEAQEARYWKLLLSVTRFGGAVSELYALPTTEPSEPARV
jgi:hypothetical protein